jgi:hypothetical protein
VTAWNSEPSARQHKAGRIMACRGIVRRSVMALSVSSRTRMGVGLRLLCCKRQHFIDQPLAPNLGS